MGSWWILVSLLPNSSPYFIIGEYPNMNPNPVKTGFPRQIRGGYPHVWVKLPCLLELKKIILEEGHMSGLSIHSDSTKMYQDLKKIFWWPGMNKDVVEFVYYCLTCQKYKIEHQKPSGLVQPSSILEWITFLWIL